MSKSRSAIAVILVVAISELRWLLATGGNGLKVGSLAIGVPKLWPFLSTIFTACLAMEAIEAGTPRELLSRAPNLLVFTLLIDVYLINGRTIATGDSAGTRWLPLAILRYRTCYLDRFFHGTAVPYFLNRIDGHVVSAYPIGAAIVAAPFYFLPVVFGLDAGAAVFSELEKISAAAITALSAVVLYQALKRISSPRFALVLSIIYGLGTSSLSSSSQALWQHGGAQLLIATALYCVIRGEEEPRFLGYAGLPLSFAVVCRPADVLIALPIGIYILILNFRESVRAILFAQPGLWLQALYNLRYFHHLLHLQFLDNSGVLYDWEKTGNQGIWSASIWPGFEGILASPGRGLFIYSPIFIFSLIGLVVAARRPRPLRFILLSLSALLTVVLCSKWRAWSGGYCYGPRLLADITPVLIVLIAPVEPLLARSIMMRRVFIALAAASFAMHLPGMLFGDAEWDVWAGLDINHRMWLLSDNPPLNRYRIALEREWIRIRNLPTSRSSPQLLGARYILLPPSEADAPPGAQVTLVAKAVNSGDAVWLADSIHNSGTVTLKWRLYSSGDTKPVKAGWVPLHHNIFFEQTAEFELMIKVPVHPGIYHLTAGMCAQPSLDFSALGIVPIQFELRVPQLRLAPPISARSFGQTGFESRAVRRGRWSTMLAVNAKSRRML